MANHIVAGEMYYNLDGQLLEIKRQLRNKEGYRHDPRLLRMLLQDAIDGDFGPAPIFYETNELNIKIPALPRPTLQEVQVKFPRLSAIDKDTSPEKVVSLALSTLTSSASDRLGAKEYGRVVMMNDDSVLGYQHCHWLNEHQFDLPDLASLRGKFAIHFPGTRMVDADTGIRYIPYLSDGGGRWAEFLEPLFGDRRYNWGIRVATMEKVRIFGKR